MSFLPKSRAGLLWRAFLAAFLVVGFAAGATAVAGLLQVKNIVDEFHGDTQHIADVTLPSPGAPQTILIIGSDHRAHTSYTSANTDTMLLVRINDSSSTVNLMSVPRDLEVLGPGGSPTKLNGIYSEENGPDGLIAAMKQQVFGPSFQVNHVIDLNFTGFSDLVDAIGCVYSDIDRRYYNVSEPAPSPDNFSSIDIQPGYQKLCGGGYSSSGNGALAFVRYRHTDTDEVRNARQQDFIRWARDNYSTDQLAENEGVLLKDFAKHSTVDSSFGSENGLIELFDLVLDASKLTLKTIQFPEYFGQNIAGQADYVHPCPTLSFCSGYGGPAPTLGQPTDATEQIWNEFITPTIASAASTTTPDSIVTKKKVKRTVNLNGLVADPADGNDQAQELGEVGLPIYYPKYIDTGGQPGDQTYCFSATEDCDPTALEPPTAYDGSYPRRYLISGPDGTAYKSYVMTLALNQGEGEFYSIQGTTWKDPPLLRKPSRIYQLNGKKLLEFDDGAKIATVAFFTPTGTYWVENTLNNAISNSQMVSMAAEMTRYTGKS